MRILKEGLQMILPEVQNSDKTLKAINRQPLRQNVVLACYREYLEALIYDERYEEAGKLNQKLQALKRSHP